MPKQSIEEMSRLVLQIRADGKAMLRRAAALTHIDLATFVLQQALEAARSVIAHAEPVRLSERDTLRVLDLLEDPPSPNDALLAAARALPK